MNNITILDVYTVLELDILVWLDVETSYSNVGLTLLWNFTRSQLRHKILKLTDTAGYVHAMLHIG